MNTLYELINAFIKARKFRIFLEIGTAGGEIVIFLLYSQVTASVSTPAAIQ